MLDGESDFDGGWDDAVDHGHRLADWIGDQENYTHLDYPGRDVDGRFNRKVSANGLSGEAEGPRE